MVTFFLLSAYFSSVGDFKRENSPEFLASFPINLPTARTAIIKVSNAALSCLAGRLARIASGANPHSSKEEAHRANWH